MHPCIGPEMDMQICIDLGERDQPLRPCVILFQILNNKLGVTERISFKKTKLLMVNSALTSNAHKIACYALLHRNRIKLQFLTS